MVLPLRGPRRGPEPPHPFVTTCWWPWFCVSHPSSCTPARTSACVPGGWRHRTPLPLPVCCPRPWWGVHALPSLKCYIAFLLLTSESSLYVLDTDVWWHIVLSYSLLPVFLILAPLGASRGISLWFRFARHHFLVWLVESGASSISGSTHRAFIYWFFFFNKCLMFF